MHRLKGTDTRTRQWLITKIEIFDSTKDENGKKHVPIKVHFIGVGILEIPDTQTIIAAKEEIRKNPPSAA